MTLPPSALASTGPSPRGASAPARLAAHLLGAALAGAVVGAADGLLATVRAGMDPLEGPARAAALGLGACLHVGVATPLGLLLGVLGWLLGTPGGARLRRALLSPPGLGAAAAVVMFGAASLWLRLQGRELDWRSLDPRGPALLLGGAVLYLGAARALRALPRAALLTAAALLPPALGAGAAAVYARAGEGRAPALLRLAGEAALSARLQSRALALLDRDGDGFPRLLCTAGCDCDDRDAGVFPGARDVPGNGLDEDCSGADASAAEAERFADLFAAPVRRPAPSLDVPVDWPADLPEPPPAGEPVSEARPAHRSRRERRQAKREARRQEKRAKDAARLAQLKRPERRSRSAPASARGTLVAMRARYDAPPRRAGPNILLLTVDTLRADHLGAYGYPFGTSPRIDAWARGAAVFEQARAAGPATRFSIPAMMTGKHFTEVRRSAAEWPRVDDSEVLLAERLRDAGYFTAAFHSVVYLQDHYGFGQGFTYRDLSFFRYAQDAWMTPTADYVTDRVLQYADRGALGRRQPFFLWAYYGDPHAPHTRHAEFPARGPRYAAAYDSEVAFSDFHVGRLLDGLRERGLLDDTYVIFMADHGEGLDRREDHGSKYHSKSLYDELIRVPLIIAGPGVRPGRVATPVSLIDLVPTVLDVLGRPGEPYLRGESLLPYLRGESPPHRPVFAEKHRAEDAIQKCMVLWPYKVIVVLPYNEVSIYNLAEDPRERRNLAGTLPQAERDRLLGAYHYWAANVLRPTPDNPRH